MKWLASQSSKYSQQREGMQATLLRQRGSTAEPGEQRGSPAQGNPLGEWQPEHEEGASRLEAKDPEEKTLLGWEWRRVCTGGFANYGVPGERKEKLDKAGKVATSQPPWMPHLEIILICRKWETTSGLGKEITLLLRKLGRLFWQPWVGWAVYLLL